MTENLWLVILPLPMKVRICLPFKLGASVKEPVGFAEVSDVETATTNIPEPPLPALPLLVAAPPPPPQ